MFHEVISLLISNFKTTPVQSDFDKMLSYASEKYAKNINEIEKKELEKNKVKGQCSKCHNSGFVEAFKKSTKSAYTFKCNCNIGKRMREVYPVWGSSYLQFELINFYE